MTYFINIAFLIQFNIEAFMRAIQVGSSVFIVRI